MPGKQFQFDEDGDVFYCFFVAFYTLTLIPLTYYLLSSNDQYENLKISKRCRCKVCQSKVMLTKISSGKKEIKKSLKKIFLVFCWLIFINLVHRLSEVKESFVSTYDPFAILNIDKDATTSQIRRAYKMLSLKHHPDKGGDEKTFILISKAYSALTNEDMKKNWIEFGNPDGPEAASYGIALPKWLIMKENKYLVLGFYVFLFLLVLPIGVGTWWRNTVRYSASKVLLITKNVFMSELLQNPFQCKRSVIQLVSKALEFSSEYNKEIILRSSDNYDLSSLIKNLPEFTIFKKAVIGSPYSVKAKALIYAHLRRLELPVNLKLDKDYIIKNCPKLLNELIELCKNAMFLGNEESDQAAKSKRMALYLATLENFMDFLPMIFQAMSDELSPLMQLPHFSLTQIRAITSKAKNVKSIQQLAAMPDATRRNVLNSLTDEEYNDVIQVLCGMPELELDYLCEVIDDVDRTIRPMSVITCRIWLKRTPLISMESYKSSKLSSNYQFSNGDNENSYSSNNMKEKNDENEKLKSQEMEDEIELDPSKASQPKEETESEECPDCVKFFQDGDKFKNTMGFKSEKQNQGQNRAKIETDEIRLKKLKAQKSSGVCSHLVHCPYFPVEKFEGWWVYLVDRRTKRIISEPRYVYSLQEEFYMEFQFFAPIQAGNYLFNLMVRSDCYVGFDYTETIRFTVDKPINPQEQIFNLLKVPKCHTGCDDSDDDDELSEDEDDNHTMANGGLRNSAIESSSDEYVSSDDGDGDNQKFSFLGIF